MDICVYTYIYIYLFGYTNIYIYINILLSREIGLAVLSAWRALTKYIEVQQFLVPVRICNDSNTDYVFHVFPCIYFNLQWYIHTHIIHIYIYIHIYAQRQKHTDTNMH